MGEEPDHHNHKYNSNSLLKPFFERLRKIVKKDQLEDSADVAEEIHDIMDEGQALGLVSDEESNMVYGVLDLKETNVDSIMIPRTDVFFAPHDITLENTIKLVSDCGHTRIPIYKGDIDTVIGVLHTKDLFSLWGKDPSTVLPPDIIRPPFFVPENRKVSELFTDLRASQNHLAVVLDEYGGTSGIVTIEDILEQIVGEIMDEHDSEEVMVIYNSEDSSLTVDARLEVEKLEKYNIKIPEGDYESVGGFIISLLGKIPVEGEVIKYENLIFIIKSAEIRKIKQVHISGFPPYEPEEH